jgi:lipid A ethanolaminephosphotransferase
MENKQKLISTSSFVIALTIINLIVYHFSLYLYISQNVDLGTLNGLLSLSVVFVLAFFLTSILFFILFLINSVIAKISISILFFINTLSIYFINNYKIIIDRAMIGNILNTNFEESYDFLHFDLIVYILIFAIIPIFFIFKVNLKKISRIKVFLHGVLIVIISILWIYVNSSTWIWIDKHAKNLGANIMPWSYIINTIRYTSIANSEFRNQKLLPNPIFENDNKMLVVLIIGESARSQNFSLYGYKKNTNPLLSKQNIVVLKNSKSCSTYTTKSLECMLSHDSGNDEYEVLPSYLSRNGVDTIWHSNNWGQASLKVDTYQDRSSLENDCINNQCGYDGSLLNKLETRINNSTSKKIFAVLHQKGSHGPKYSERYPEEFEVFKPVCKSVVLNDCNKDSLVNAYNNSIVYTDYVISNTIDMLKKIAIPSMLIYVSDHGESLGESGLYLHGTPMIIAPKEQTDIPFILWLSDDYKSKIKGIKNLKSYNHFNVFHTTMGAFGLNSEIYLKNLDILEK